MISARKELRESQCEHDHHILGAKGEYNFVWFLKSSLVYQVKWYKSGEKQYACKVC
jgi:hypothetical protein